MPIRVACSYCGKRLQVRDELVGKKAKCPRCGKVFVAVAETEPPEAAPAAPGKPGRHETPAAAGGHRHPPRPALQKPAPPPADEQDDETPEEVPTKVGPFEIVEKIARGGTATVYKARDAEGNIVALKINHRFLSLDPTHVERFKREFTGLAELSHPHLVKALDFGETGDVSYLVLEFIPGRSLEQRLKQQGPLPLHEALEVFSQVAEGLRFLHQHRILHRDIKPGNILLGDDGVVKLADFGLLKNLAADSMITRSRQSMGTMEYGAPEQFENAKTVDFRCDLYSLAAALYTALTGQFPFGVGGHLKILQRKLHAQFVPLRQALPAAPTPLDDLVARSLQPQREQRPSDIEEFIAGLQAAQSAAEPAPPPLPDETEPPPSDYNERRAEVRLASTLPAAFVPFHQAKRGSWSATVLDISRGGLRLRTTQPFPANTVLEIQLPGRAAAYLVQVRWIHTVSEQTHILGCAFVRPLADGDVEGMSQPPTA